MVALVVGRPVPLEHPAATTIAAAPSAARCLRERGDMTTPRGSMSGVLLGTKAADHEAVMKTHPTGDNFIEASSTARPVQADEDLKEAAMRVLVIEDEPKMWSLLRR